MDKSWSFSSRNSNSNGRQQWELGDLEEHLHERDLTSLPQVLEDVDCFLNSITTSSPQKEVPNCVVVLTKLLDYMMDKYKRSKFGQEPKFDKYFLNGVDRIFKLSNTLSLSPSCLDKTSSVLEKAMSILENDLCALLQDPKSKTNYSRPAVPPKKSSSFGSLQLQFQLQDEREIPRPNNQDHDDDDLLPTFSTENISIMNKIADVMINMGYHTECCMTFTNFRRNYFKAALRKLGQTGVRMEEVYKMQWESLEGEIATWNKVFRHCTTVLFNAERKLYESIFPNQHSVSQGMFGNLARGVIINFLNFAQAVVLTKPSPEKLFKFLDMYETLRDDVEPVVLLINDQTSSSSSSSIYPYDIEQCAKELAFEIATTKDRIVDAVMAMFSDLENNIKGDNERIPVPYGAVHPLTRYVMNYLKYTCEYKDTLEQVFEQCHCNDNNNNTVLQEGTKASTTNTQNEKNNSTIEEESEGTPNRSPFAVQLMAIMDLLDAHTERKSKLYKDSSLRCVFLMNNGRYIVQKIKGCADLHESMGDNWCRRKQFSLRLHHKNYQIDTWSKVLQCLNPDGLHQQGNKVSKQVLREKFKCFNAMLEEIHKTQSTWMVSDDQLQSELRASISALVIPAYRSFHGRFKHHLESGRHSDKYIKYHPDDIETLIDDLFVGNNTSMSRRRT
ncbi:exocyst complex component EXO70C1 [Cicer arietinum]|uniref:Exocyst subunit Exo70 family protein n=1 Tax=Cicer arietinum TaxID=3827 RepID=A0A1S2Y1Z3_CICAR|nr:exocyst complex component EXO70B1 [Cicer arietinum]